MTKTSKRKSSPKQKSNLTSLSKPEVGESKPMKHFDNNGDNHAASWSKSKKKRMRKLRTKLSRDETSKHIPSSNVSSESVSKRKSELTKSPSKMDSIMKNNMLFESLKNRLSGGRFRELNELLYTNSSEVAFKTFSSEPVLFEQYHKGFRNQIQSWPVNPVDVIYKWLIKLRRTFEKCVTVADFGCGDAKLAEQLQNENGRFKIYSFDLVAPLNKNHDLVTPCDMSNVPLANSTIDVAVFSLALMGTNIADFIREAHRVLRVDGIIKIAEVRSRFEGERMEKEQKKGRNKNYSKRLSLLDEFLDIMTKSLGFQLVNMDNQSNKLFFLMEFKKLNVKPDPNVSFTAKACIYKRR